jgi:hypothetical protein
MRIGATGNVGIGTPTPANTLDIGNSGGIHITTGIPTSTAAALYNNAGVLTWNGSALASASGNITGNAATVTTNANMTGDVTSAGSNATTVKGINGTLLSGLASGILKNTTTTGVPSIAVAGTDYLVPAGIASALTNTTINNTAYNYSTHALASGDALSVLFNKLAFDQTDYISKSATSAVNGTLAINTLTGNLTVPYAPFGLNSAVNQQYVLDLLSKSGAVTAASTGSAVSNTATSATASIVKTGMDIQSTGVWSGATATNVGLNVNVSGGTANYAALFNGGNVGIGTTIPQSGFLLDVNGQSVTRGNMYVSGSLIEFGATAFKLAQSGNSFINGGNVGIGTAAPSTKLEIAGTSATGTSGFTNISSFTDNGLRITGTSSATTDAISYQSGSTGGGAAIEFGRGLGWDTFIAFATNATSGTATGNMTERMRIDAAGNVGIGTTGPGYPLDVVGALNSQVTGTGGTSNTSYANFTAYNPLNSYPSAAFLIGQNSSDTNVTLQVAPLFSSPTVSINSQVLLSRNKNTTLAGNLTGYIQQTSTAFNITSLVAGNASASASPITFSPGGSESMRLLTNGNVGIGTTAPSAKMEISGAGVVGAPTIGSASGSILRLVDSTNVGDYGGSVEFGGKVNQTFASIKGLIQNGTTNGVGDLAIYTRNAVADTAMTERMRVLASGNVGIGTITPSEKLEVSGNVKATSFLYTSDRRLKKNVKPIENSLPKILALTGVSFNWKKNGVPTIGFIAQDVEKVIPEVVKTDSQSSFKSVEYANIVALVVEAFKKFFHETMDHFSRVDRNIASVKEENITLKEQVKSQQIQIDLLAKRLERLEKKK